MPTISTSSATRTKLFSVNSTVSSFTALNETLVSAGPNPGGSSVYLMSGKNSLLVWPFGTDADGELFDIRIALWWKGNLSWGYSVGFLGTCTLSAETGVAGGDVTNTDLYCDAITFTSGVATYQIQGGGTDAPALLRIDTMGATYADIDIDVNTAASANAMIASI